MIFNRTHQQLVVICQETIGADATQTKMHFTDMLTLFRNAESYGHCSALQQCPFITKASKSKNTSKRFTREVADNFAQQTMSEGGKTTS